MNTRTVDTADVQAHIGLPLGEVPLVGGLEHRTTVDQGTVAIVVGLQTLLHTEKPVLGVVVTDRTGDTEIRTVEIVIGLAGAGQGRFVIAGMGAGIERVGRHAVGLRRRDTAERHQGNCE